MRWPEFRRILATSLGHPKCPFGNEVAAHTPSEVGPGAKGGSRVGFVAGFVALPHLHPPGNESGILPNTVRANQSTAYFVVGCKCVATLSEHRKSQSANGL